MDKKYILISGVNGGIGKATALKLLSENYFVIGTDLVDPKIENNNFKFIKCDITNNENIADLHEKVLKITDNLYSLINLAGIFKLQSLVEGNEEDLRKIIEVNFYGTYHLSRTFIDQLKNNGRLIVFSSEVARYSPQPFNGYYALSKKLVDSFADIFRRECNYIGIKVIKVQSGAIKTGLLDGVNKEYETAVNKTQYFKSALTKLKGLMDNEIEKETSPEIVAKLFSKILSKNNPKICYRIKNSLSLECCNALPEVVQDKLYKTIIK